MSCVAILSTIVNSFSLHDDVSDFLNQGEVFFIVNSFSLHDDMSDVLNQGDVTQYFACVHFFLAPTCH